jgi:hypothetical protein
MEGAVAPATWVGNGVPTRPQLDICCGRKFFEPAKPFFSRSQAFPSPTRDGENARIRAASAMAKEWRRNGEGMAQERPATARATPEF